MTLAASKLLGSLGLSFSTSTTCTTNVPHTITTSLSATTMADSVPWSLFIDSDHKENSSQSNNYESTRRRTRRKQDIIERRRNDDTTIDRRRHPSPPPLPWQKHRRRLGLASAIFFVTVTSSNTIFGSELVVAMIASRSALRRWPVHPRPIAYSGSCRRLLSNDNNADSEDDFLMTQVDGLLQELVETTQKTQKETTLILDDDALSTTQNGWIQISENLVLRVDEIATTTFKPSAVEKQLPVESPVEQRIIRGRNIWWKRDDMLKLPGSAISGNKARKMWTLDQWAAATAIARPVVDDDDTSTILPFPQCLVSYGGPQSNSMLALAAIVNYKNRQQSYMPKPKGAEGASPTETKDLEEDYIHQQPYRFVYYTKKLPRFLRNQPSGNLFRAQSLGMELKELSHEEYNHLFQHAEDGSRNIAMEDIPPPPIPGQSLFVPQGGAFAAAREGAFRLAREIYGFWKRSEYFDKPLSVCLPGGTCSTALLVHHGLKRLLKEEQQENQRHQHDNDDSFASSQESSLHHTMESMDIEVVVIPCVGDASYARRQMMSLSVQVGADAMDIPTILQPAPESTDQSKSYRYYTFGKPHQDLLKTFEELRDKYDIVVDLLYGAPAWSILWRHWNTVGNNNNNNNTKDLLSPDLIFDPNSPLSGREIMYVHSGGVEGVNSQMLRYKHDGLVKIRDVQLPGRPSRGSCGVEQ